jgi:hypothetical protein
MSGVTVTWASGNTAAADVSVTGMVTAIANGTAEITATAGAATGRVTVTVTQSASVVVPVTGQGQSAVVTTSLPDSLVAVARDALDHPVAGSTVSFTVSAGGGTVSPTSAVSDAAGRVATRWTFGTAAGTHTVTAQAGAVACAFQATALADVGDSMYVAAGNNQTGRSDAPLLTPLSVGVLDQYRNPVPGHLVAFTPATGDGSVSPSPVSTGASGHAVTTWTLGPTLGTQSLQATAGGLKGEPLIFTATAEGVHPASVELHAGNGQVGLASYPVNVPPSVLARDEFGYPLAGATVTFAVASGTGAVTAGTATTDANGIAEVGSWVVGLGANTLTATVTGSSISGNPVTFSATGATQQFNIVLRYVTDPAPEYENAFTVARDRWQLLIFGDVPAIQVNLDANTPCGDVTLPSAINETVDDIVIYVDLQPIDGPNGFIGSAGPCYVRYTGMPALGSMKFDTADLDYLYTNGLLDETIVHNMGHVLGFGTLWTYSAIDLLRDPSDTSEGGTLGADAHFNGAQALWAFNRVGGATYAGAKVPVENDYTRFESGSLDSHWRESAFGTELMTPLLNGAVDNPLSKVTAAAMGDIGYTVNYAAADSFALPGPAAVAAAGAAQAIDLGNDVAGGPVYLVDASGRVVGAIRR